MANSAHDWTSLPQEETSDPARPLSPANSTWAEDPNAVEMLRVGEGDDRAFARLVHQWQAPMVNFFYRSIGSDADAEFLAQTVFIKLYRNASRYQPTARFSTFLFHIARRVLLNEYRRRRRKPLHSIDPADPAWQGQISEEDNRPLREIEECFQRAIGDLSENQRTAILLFKQQGLTYQEIAEIMQASESAVKTWIFRAREKLRKDMKS